MYIDSYVYALKISPIIKSALYHSCIHSLNNSHNESSNEPGEYKTYPYEIEAIT
jgi:hypothetical protein